MPYDEPDETDPMMLIGVELPGDQASSLESCRVFAEEFARMGFDEKKLMDLFRNPFYAGPHNAYRELGEERVQAIVRECAAVWGAVSFRERDVDPETGLCSLPVLPAGAGGHRRSSWEGEAPAEPCCNENNLTARPIQDPRDSQPEEE